MSGQPQTSKPEYNKRKLAIIQHYEALMLEESGDNMPNSWDKNFLREHDLHLGDYVIKLDNPDDNTFDSEYPFMT